MTAPLPQTTASDAELVARLLDAVRSESDAWLIRKGGYYYRPNCQGYTTVKAQAGRYTEEKAKSEAAIEPGNMLAIPADDVPGAAFEINSSEAASLLDRLDKLSAEVAAKDAALLPFAKAADDVDGAVCRGLPDNWDAGFMRFNLGQCRAARAALSPRMEAET